MALCDGCTGEGRVLCVLHDSEQPSTHKIKLSRAAEHKSDITTAVPNGSSTTFINGSSRVQQTVCGLRLKAHTKLTKKAAATHAAISESFKCVNTQLRTGCSTAISFYFIMVMVTIRFCHTDIVTKVART
jgi:hypothetical protein